MILLASHVSKYSLYCMLCCEQRKIVKHELNVVIHGLQYYEWKYVYFRIFYIALVLDCSCSIHLVWMVVIKIGLRGEVGFTSVPVMSPDWSVTLGVKCGRTTYNL